jgi:iron complex outermembrane receptor protein
MARLQEILNGPELKESRALGYRNPWGSIMNNARFPSDTFFRRSSLLMLSVGLTALAAPALAQTAPANPAPAASDAGDGIVVTAQRRSESIQRVPIAITAINAAALAKSDVRGIEDYFAMTPNVSFVSNGSRDRKDLALRGISNQLDPYSNVRPSAYAFYIDDFSVAAGTSNPEIVDLERIEVLRGPQGTYFGRNSIGGAINVTTKKPTQNWEGEVHAGYASFNALSASAVLNAPVIHDLLAIRVAAQIEKSDGNIHNINAIGGGNNTNYKNARVIARLTPANNITDDLSFTYTRERDGMRSGVPTGYLTATWRSVYYGGAAGLADPNGVGFYPNNTNKVNYNRPQSVGTDYWSVSNHLVIEGPAVTVTAVGGYLRATTFNYGDVDGSSYDYFYENNHLVRDSVSGELRVQSSGHHRFEWSAGVNAGYDTGLTNQHTYFGTAGLLGRPAGFEITGIDSFGNDRYQAAFGQGTFHLTDKFDITIGGRYSHEEIGTVYLQRSNGSVTNNTVRSKSYNDFSPRFNLSWKATPDLMLFATVSRGFKSGGVQTTTLIANTFYNPESLWNYEGGAKFTALGGRFRADLSGFYMKWKNIQLASRFQYLNSSGQLLTVTGIDNAAAAVSYGLDGSFDFKVTPHLTWSMHGGYDEAHFTNYPTALIDGAYVNASGKPLINAPKWTAGGSLEYRQRVKGDVEGFLRPEWTYRSSTYSNLLALRYSTYPFISPGYNSFNLRAGIEDKRRSLIFFVENLTNAKYYANVYEKAFYSGVQVEPSVRRFGVSASYKF